MLTAISGNKAISASKFTLFDSQSTTIIQKGIKMASIRADDNVLQGHDDWLDSSLGCTFTPPKVQLTSIKKLLSDSLSTKAWKTIPDHDGADIEKNAVKGCVEKNTPSRLVVIGRPAPP